MTFAHVPVPEDSLTTLPDDLLRCIGNNHILIDRDRANLALSCPTLSAVFKFRRITLAEGSWTSASHDGLANALVSGCCKVLEGASVSAEDLHAVGIEFPERVAQLQEARVSTPSPCDDGGLGPLLSRAAFPALRRIRLVGPVTHPQIEDPRIELETAIVDNGGLRPPCLRVASGIVETLDLRLDGFDEANVGRLVACLEASCVSVKTLRVSQHFGNVEDVPTLSLAERVAAAVAPLATHELCCTNPYHSLTMVQHVSPSVCSFELIYYVGTMVALEQRLVPPHAHAHAHAPVSLLLYQFHTPGLRDDDLAALRSLIERGLVATMDMEAGNDCWGPIAQNMCFLRRAPRLRIGSATVDEVIHLFWPWVAEGQDAEARCVDLHLRLKDDDPSFHRLDTLALSLAAWPHLRLITMRQWPRNDGADYARFENIVTERSGGRIRVFFLKSARLTPSPPPPQRKPSSLCVVQ